MMLTHKPARAAGGGGRRRRDRASGGSAPPPPALADHRGAQHADPRRQPRLHARDRGLRGTRHGGRDRGVFGFLTGTFVAIALMRALRPERVRLRPRRLPRGPLRRHRRPLGGLRSAAEHVPATLLANVLFALAQFLLERQVPLGFFLGRVLVPSLILNTLSRRRSTWSCACGCAGQVVCVSLGRGTTSAGAAAPSRTGRRDKPISSFRPSRCEWPSWSASPPSSSASSCSGSGSCRSSAASSSWPRPTTTGCARLQSRRRAAHRRSQRHGPRGQPAGPGSGHPPHGRPGGADRRRSCAAWLTCSRCR